MAAVKQCEDTTEHEAHSWGGQPPYYFCFGTKPDMIEESMNQHDDWSLSPHRTEANWPPENCATCNGGGCLDCTDLA